MTFRILGPVQVEDGPRRLVLGGPKPRALAAVLLIHASPVVSTDRLIDELWVAAKDRAEQSSKVYLLGARSRAPPDQGAART
jgi:DNA-binding SARP family transcriptional activator